MQGRQIIIADSQDITRLGLEALIKGALTDTDYLEVKEARQRSELIELLKEMPNAVVVIDNTFFLVMGEELQSLSLSFPQAMWVLFTDELSEMIVRYIGENPHFSIVLKADSAHEIATALKYAMVGVRFLCHQVSNMLLSAQQQQQLLERDGLTSTEIEVLKLIAFGKSVKEIASERNSSIHTIISHKKNIFRKINVSTIYEATKYAFRAGLVEVNEYYK